MIDGKVKIECHFTLLLISYNAPLRDLSSAQFSCSLYYQHEVISFHHPMPYGHRRGACSNVFSCSPRRSGSKTIANVPVVVRHPTSVPVGATSTRHTNVVPVKLVRTNNHNLAPMTVRINNHHNAPMPGRNASNAPVVITRSQSTPNQQVHFQDDVEFDDEEERSLTMSALMNYAKKIEDGRLMNILDKMNEEGSVTADNAPPPTDYINIVAQKNNSNTESLKSDSTDNKDIQNSARPGKLSMKISRFRLNKKAINVTEGESGLEVEEHSICSSTALASTTDELGINTITNNLLYLLTIYTINRHEQIEGPRQLLYINQIV